MLSTSLFSHAPSSINGGMAIRSRSSWDDLTATRWGGSGDNRSGSGGGCGCSRWVRRRRVAGRSTCIAIVAGGGNIRHVICCIFSAMTRRCSMVAHDILMRLASPVGPSGWGVARGRGGKLSVRHGEDKIGSRKGECFTLAKVKQPASQNRQSIVFSIVKKLKREARLNLNVKQLKTYCNFLKISEDKRRFDILKSCQMMKTQ